MIIKRESYMKQNDALYNTDVIKVLTGMRRSGKSVMFELIKEELIETGVSENSIVSINFDSLKNPILNDVLSAYTMIENFTLSTEGRVYLFLDEIGELKEWEKLLQLCLLNFNCDIYISSSNGHLLKGLDATSLAGRYVEIPIYPFSFSESLLYLQEHYKKVNIDEAFLFYVTYGGLPFIYQFARTREGALSYLEDVFHSIILKDITMRAQVRDIELLRRIILYFFSHIGSSFSVTHLIAYLNNEKNSYSHETIYNYIEYGKMASLYYLVPRYDIQARKLLSSGQKIFLSDHGLRESLYGNNLNDIEEILTNIIYIELLRRGYTVYAGKIKNKEIDFIATTRNKKIYIQVAYLLESDETIEKEFSPLESIQDNYPKIILSMDTVLKGRGGIIHQNIKEFLLQMRD